VGRTALAEGGVVMRRPGVWPLGAGRRDPGGIAAFTGGDGDEGHNYRQPSNNAFIIVAGDSRSSRRRSNRDWV